MQQRRSGKYRGNKYEILQATHRYNTRYQVHKGTRVEPTAQHIELIATNIQVKNKSNIVIDPTTGASLDYRHPLKVPTRAIWENYSANITRHLAQVPGTRIP